MCVDDLRGWWKTARHDRGTSAMPIFKVSRCRMIEIASVLEEILRVSIGICLEAYFENHHYNFNCRIYCANLTMTEQLRSRESISRLSLSEFFAGAT
jgi:hypothetical protein